jgi:triacylglycerol lipase
MPGTSRLARLLQFSCLTQLATAFAWLAWRWPASPLQALAGALLIPLLAPIVLGIELMVVAAVARGDAPVPIPTATQLARAWTSETVHWFRTFWWRQPFRWGSAQDLLDGDSMRQGVVFIHGFMCNRGFWTPWMRRLQERGHPCVAVNLEPVFTSIDGYADTIEAAVLRVTQASGGPPVLICHSMGGLAARAWWRARGSAGRVTRIITIGSPHGGTLLARFSRKANGRQMRLRSDWVEALGRHEQTHGRPPMTCWYSNCDNVVFPASTATLAGADNRFVAGQPHVGLAFDPQVIDGCLQLLATGKPARQGDSVTSSATVNG